MQQKTVSMLGALALTAGMGWQVALAGNPNPTVYPGWAKPYGTTITEWTQKWWQWAFSIPFTQNPMVDTTGANAGLNQSGPVWFLAGTAGGDPVERDITIPVGKAILIPIVNYLNDFPCPDPNFKPPEGQTLQEFLQAGTAWYLAHVKELKVTLDGVDLKDLMNYRFTSDLFLFTADVSLQQLDPCVTGQEQPGVADGYWVMLAPLSAGKHELHIYGRSEFTLAEDGFDAVFLVDVTDHLTVGK